MTQSFSFIKQFHNISANRRRIRETSTFTACNSHQHKGLWTVRWDMVRNDLEEHPEHISSPGLRPFSRGKSLSQLALMCMILDGRFIDLPPQIRLPPDGSLQWLSGQHVSTLWPSCINRLHGGRAAATTKLCHGWHYSFFPFHTCLFNMTLC